MSKGDIFTFITQQGVEPAPVYYQQRTIKRTVIKQAPTEYHYEKRTVYVNQKVPIEKINGFNDKKEFNLFLCINQPF